MVGRITEADLPIVTDRLVLRRFRAEDGPAILGLYGDPEVSRYLYSEPMQPEGLEEALARRLLPPRLEAEGDILELAAELRSTGEFVGQMVIFLRSLDHQRGEIGWTISPKFAGQGLATEGGAAMLRFGFEVLGLHRIEAQCDGRHLASARIMTKLGMRQEAYFVDYEYVKGEWTDCRLTAMLGREWKTLTEEPGQ